MASVFERLWRPGLLIAVAIFALAVAVELIRPIHAASVGFDAAASVVYFDRIIAGRQLEDSVTATPKPLLTLVYGGLMALANDWRVVGWASIGSYVASVVLATFLGLRFGGVVAALAASGLLLASRSLLADVSLAYAMSWALLLWLVAAAVLTGKRPRYAVAGIALALATLARLETIGIVATALLAVAWAAWRDRRANRAVDTGRWWLLLALTALPVMLVHDQLLTGDPWYWVGVSAEYSRQNPTSVRTPLELAIDIVGRLAQTPVILGFGLVGFFTLARQRLVVPFVGLIGMTLGVAVFLVATAARGTYVSERYLIAIDLGIDLAAALGAAAVASAATASWRRRGRAARGEAGRSQVSASGGLWRRVVVPAVVLVLLLVGTWPPISLDGRARTAARNLVIEARHADLAVAALRCNLGAGSGGAPSTVLLAPTLLRPRLAHDLGLPLDQVNGTSAATVDPNGLIAVGSVVLHDRRVDRPLDAYSRLEVAVPTNIGGVTLIPLIHDRVAGLWLDWIVRPGDRPAPAPCAG